MVQTEFASIGISFIGIVIQVITTYFDKKGFLERFQKYQEDIDKELTGETKNELAEIDKLFKNKKDVYPIVKRLAEKIEKYKEPSREYFGIYKGIKIVYILFFISIITSLLSLQNPLGKFGEYSYGMWGFMLSIAGIILLGISIWKLQTIGEKALAFELKIPVDVEDE